MYNIALVYKYSLIAKGLAKIIEEGNKNFKVVLIKNTAHDLIVYLKQKPTLKIDLVIIDNDINGLNGIDLSYILTRDYPNIFKIALSSSIHSEKIIAFLYTGCKGFISKWCELENLIHAIEHGLQNKYFINDFVSLKVINKIKTKKIEFDFPMDLKDNHYFFIKLCSTNLPYKSIANILNIQENTLHKIQQRMFEKFKVNSKVELFNYANENNIISNRHYF